MRLLTLITVVVLLLVGSWFLLREDHKSSAPLSGMAVGAARNDSPSPEAVAAAGEDSAAGGARTAVEVEDPPTAGDSATEERARLVVLVNSSDTGIPVAGARMFLTGPNSSWGRHVDRSSGTLGEAPRSGERGRIEFDVPSGVELELRGDPSIGVPPRSIPPLAPGESREESVRVPTAPDLRLYVRVVRGEDGLPIAGAEVRLQSSGGVVEDAAVRAITDEKGFAFLEVRRATVRGGVVVAEGRAPAVFVPERADTPENALIVPLHLPASIIGTVTGDVEHLLVRANMPTGSSYDVGHLMRNWETGHRRHVWETVNQSGSFRFEEIVPRVEIELSLLRHGEVLWQEKGIFLEPGEEREVAYHLGSGARIEGIVSETDGLPIADFEVWLVRDDGSKQLSPLQEPYARANTDGDGVFAFEDVAAGKWRIGPAPPTSEVPSQTKLVDVSPGTTFVRADLMIHRGLYVQGTVLDTAGAPAESVDVFAVTEDGFREGAQTDACGRFRIGPLPPGSCMIDARARDEYSEPVQACAGDQDVVLRLQAAASISGRVIDENGEFRQAEVVLAGSLGDIRSGNLGSMSLGWAAGGQFMLDGLRPGTYAVTARAGDFVGVSYPIVVSVGASVSDIVVRLKRGGRLEVHVQRLSDVHVLFAASGGAVVGYMPFNEPGTPSTPMLLLPEGEARILLTAVQMSSLEVLDEVSARVVAGERRTVRIGNAK